MSILIRGMEMPKNCDVCFMRDACEYSMPLGKRLTDCPLIEVPMSHGRLIDADAFQLEAYNMMFRGHADDRDVAFVNFLLGKAPTIIESEDE